jgi:hypothetical protein
LAPGSAETAARAADRLELKKAALEDHAVFIGHFGAGLAWKKTAPRVSLGTLFLAAQFIDLLWPTLLLVGVERVQITPGAKGPPLTFTHYPLSHSLLMVVVWAALFGVVYQFVRRYRAGALVCALAVLSHWVLDLIVHHPDLPLYPGGGPQLGFGLWDSLGATLVLKGCFLRWASPCIVAPRRRSIAWAQSLSGA